MKLRKGDMVIVIAGREKGKRGKVVSLDRQHQTVLVEKVNFVKRHQRPTSGKKQGGIVEKEAKLAISNVMFYDEKAGKATRLGFKVDAQGKKVRIEKRTGSELPIANFK